jgi:hypothetical protein
MGTGKGDPEPLTQPPVMTTFINGRSFELTEDVRELSNLRRYMISQGFDGTIWMGFSARTGRQRKDLHSMIYRKPSGEFVIAASF